MNCPICGEPMKEGQVYCENCGKELQFVPVFEPEIEESIQESMNGVVEEFAEGTTNENSFAAGTETAETETAETAAEETSKSRLFSGKLKLYIGVIAGIIVLVLFIVSIILLNNYYSYDYQISKAAEAMASGNYQDTITYAGRAAEIEPDSPETKMLMAGAYIKLSRVDDAIYILEELIADDNTYEEAYEQLIILYEVMGRYEEINQLLLKCPDSSIIEKYQIYLASVPSFSQEEGTYEEVVSLKLLTDGIGTIYYTLDGNAPTEGSIKYTAPIRMEKGTFVVSAVFVNDFGVFSDVITRTYTVEIQEPDEPQISADSGEYTTPVMIEISVPDNYEVYYTTKKTDPTPDSIPYTNPLPMPIGSSEFRFIMYDEEGVASNVVTRNYNLNLQANVPIEEAINLLKQSLIDRGEMLDFAGHVAGVTDTKDFACYSAFSQEDQVFYLIIEYYVTVDGSSRSRSGKIYAVDILSGALYRATVDAAGYYMVEAF